MYLCDMPCLANPTPLCLCALKPIGRTLRLRTVAIRRDILSGDLLPCLYVLFYTVMPGIKPVTCLPFRVCTIAE